MTMDSNQTEKPLSKGKQIQKDVEAGLTSSQRAQFKVEVAEDAPYLTKIRIRRIIDEHVDEGTAHEDLAL